MDINKLSFTISGSSGSATRSLDNLVRKLGALNTAFTTSTASGKGFIDVLERINTLSGSASTGMGALRGQTKQVSTAMSKVRTSTATATNAINNTEKSTSRLSRSMTNLHVGTTRSGDSFSRLVKRLTQLTFVVYVARKALHGFFVGIQTSIAYVENLNLFMVALGENTSRATGFIKEMSENLYLDEARLTRVQGLFYQISESLGLGSDKAYTLSENFTKLANDLASFYNITIDDAVIKLQAGLVGETEPLRRIGIIITENNLAETARNLGIRKSIRNMTEMEKIQLRYVTALQQTKNAQGDLARTMDQPENLLRILKDQMSVFARELGNVAIPIIEKLVPEIIGLVMALTKLAKAFAEAYGYDAPVIRDDLGGYMKTIADESEETEKKTKGIAQWMAKVLKYTRATKTSMTGIDELNVLSDTDSSSVGSIFSTDKALSDMSQLDIAMDDYNNRMLEFGGAFDEIVEKWETRIANFITMFKTSFAGTSEAFTTLWDTLFGGADEGEESLSKIETVLKTIDAVISGILGGIEAVVDNFKKLWNDILRPLLDKVAPNWLEWLEDGTLEQAVSKIVEILITVKIASSLLTLISGLVAIGKTGATIMAVFLLLSGLFTLPKKTVPPGEDAFHTDTEKFLGDLLIETTKDVASMMGAEGYLDALEKVETEGVELTEAGKKIEAFSNFVYDAGKFIGSLGEKWNNLLGRGINFILGPPKRNKTPIDAFAKGGYPDQGSLFIAGEAGPELVGNINGRTEVIPMYANGTPGATKFRQIDSQDVTDDLNKLFKMMGDLVKKGLKKILPEVTATLTPGGEKIKNFIDSLKMFVEGVKNTDIAKGASEKIKEFVDNLKNGTGLLGKTWKLMGNITKGMGKLAVQAFGTLNSPSARAVFASTPNEGETSTGQQREIAGGFIGGILGDSTAGMVFNLLQQIADGAILEFVQNLPQFVQAGLDMVMNLLDGVVKALPALLAEIPVIIQKIVEILTNKDTIQALITAMLDIVLQLALALPDIILALVDAIPTVIETLVEVLLDNVDMFFKVGVILASAIVEGLVNIIIGGINWLIKQINKIPFVNIGYLSTVSWTAKLAENMGFAEGGYPQQGQMFIAREAGAELVGNVGGRTSVMNNEQIVESVSRGVYEAVLQAMAEQSQKETVINLDGKRVSERMDVVNRNRGLSFGMGGY